MTTALDIALRSSAVLLIALAASASLRGRSAALRHLILAAGIFAAASVIPLRMLPAWDLPADSRRLMEGAAMTTDGAGATGGATFESAIPLAYLPIGQLVAIAWLVGFGISAMPMLSGFKRLISLTRRATPIGDPHWLALTQELAARYRLHRDVAVLKTDLPGLLATWGIRRPCVLLPSHCERWTDARFTVVLSHELAHIRRADWFIQVAAEAIRTVFWFNPLFWIACSQLRRESEHACDAAVLDAGVSPAEYASHLVEIARACRPSAAKLTSAMPIVRPSTLEWRITAMLNTKCSSATPSRRSLIIAATALVVATIPIATFRASAQQSAAAPLSGSVYDMSGGMLPQVVLTLEDATGLKREATSDGSGRFEIDAVAPGKYLLTTALPGFLPLNQELTLREARNWERAITLQVGGLRETVTVSDGPRGGAITPQTAIAGPVTVGGNIKAPRKVVDVRPIYPEAMREAGFEGIVQAECLIGVDGQVASVRLLSANAHPELARAAADAIRQWQFSPTLLNGVPVEVYMAVTVQFSLPE